MKEHHDDQSHGGGSGGIEAALVEAVEQHLKDKNPVAALLISGQWGSGKTHFLRIKQEHFESVTKKRFVTVSVAGLSSREDLEQALFLASAPWLKNGQVQAAGVFAKAALRFIKIEPKDLKFTADVQSNKVVVVIEDVDRFHGELRLLFGFVVDLIDQQRVHTIMVAAEDRLLGNNEYSEWKEKIIGQSIFVEPDIPTMVEKFINEISDEFARKKLIENNDYIKIIAQEWGINNLRGLRFAIKQVATVIVRMGSKITSLGSLERVLLGGLFLGVLEVQRSAASAAIIGKMFSHDGLSEDAQAALAGAQLEGNDLSEDAIFINNVIARYPSFQFSLFPGGVTFRAFFKNGSVSVDDMVLAFAPQVVTKPKREVFLRDYISMTQEEFDQEYMAIIGDLKAARIESLNVVARSYLTLRFLADKNSINESSDEIKRIVLESIESIDPSKVSDPDGDDDFWYMTGTDDDIDEVRKSIELKRKIAYEVSVERERSDFSWSSDPDLGIRLRDWRTRAFFVNSGKAIVSGILGLSASGLQELVRLFGSRMQFSDFRSKLAEEKQPLLEIATALEETIPSSERLSVRDSQLLQLVRSMRSFSDQLDG